MKTHQTRAPASASNPRLPDADSLAALRGWYAGLPSRAAVARYLPGYRASGESSRAMIGRIRRQLIALAESRHRLDLVAVFQHTPEDRQRQASAVERTIATLRSLPAPQPQITDAVELWLAPRTANALHAHGIRTLADLTVRIPRRHRWWTGIKGLGAAGARAVEAFFADHPRLSERARALITVEQPAGIVPWEQLSLPHEVDGSEGSFRAPREACTLNATNDYEAVQAWLALHETAATQRAYRKEAERLILWAIVEQGRALSSLTTDDAIAYRTFVRRPVPSERWVGPPRPRESVAWRPFTGGLSARSASYALTVLSALFRWLIEQRYVLANPFAGIKVRGHALRPALDAARGFTEGEWLLVRTIADGLAWSYGWSKPAAHRLCFLLDFGYATGLRASELVGAVLRDIHVDEHGDHWLHLVGKGSKPGKVALPPLARSALDQYLVQRQLPVTPQHWNPKTPLLASLGEDEDAGITGARLWRVMRRFFLKGADVLGEDHPALAEKLRRASPHWMRHSHASHALAHGAELTSVRDNLRHASIATTSMYLHGSDTRRARQITEAFGPRKSVANSGSTSV
ncbi:site-specific integrase [Burkholderia pseudomallei]|uniref:site-specific integrase n=1 Tax=Burkholderia pseudomallei TaxID=28450 RepID=UPI0009788B31|nr:site-specific integrase [Burkholderia pseudomallei]MBM5588521.1 tyrosine-type recombinase/integrase [Burkholderia pseudomallei]MBM5621852.1 tyrosine-type recombinase/integrase [Burkholderia pseudomallei]MBM5632230.1 tyrosine-type recombinase/integrase [Burkholderia pseudomallei]MBM5661898.1 tyrosine-type recombinase/integrase [Burkholderia pseudomallei]OMZ45519.1 integrase [Burkholderia pseudomallei]